MKTLTKWLALVGLPVLILTMLAVPTAHALETVRNLHQVQLPMVIGTTIGTGVATMVDFAKRLDPDGEIAEIAELLSQTNAIFEDIYWKQGNLPTGDRVTVRTALPTVAYRLLNQGVAKSKSTTAQSDEAVGILEARSEIDIDLISLEDNTASYRLSEASAFIEAMAEQFTQTLIYGNAGLNPSQYNGFSIRYSGLTTLTGAQNCISAGGAGGTNTSIWLVNWGPNTIYGVFPKGSKAGLEHKDLGINDAFDGSNNRFEAWMDKYQLKGGLAVKDWRHAVRICNFQLSVIIADPTGATENIVRLMAKSIDRIPSLGMGRPAFYMNRTMASMLRIQALATSGAYLGIEKAINQFGQTIFQLQFLGIPIRITDQLVFTETALV